VIAKLEGGDCLAMETDHCFRLIHWLIVIIYWFNSFSDGYLAPFSLTPMRYSWRPCSPLLCHALWHPRICCGWS